MLESRPCSSSSVPFISPGGAAGGAVVPAVAAAAALFAGARVVLRPGGASGAVGWGWG